VQVGHVFDHSEHTSYEDAREYDADHSDAEAVEGRVDQGEDFEEGIVNAVNQGCIQVDEGDCWVLDGNLDGLDLESGLAYESKLEMGKHTKALITTVDGFKSL
jgi:hypothetical protein